MIGRMLHVLTVLVSCVCVATVISLALGVGWMWKTGRLDKARLEAVVAAAEGKSSGSGERETQGGPEPVLPQDLADARSLKMRNLELREQALTSSLAQLRFERSQLADESDRFEMVQSAFQKKLDEMTEGLGAGRKEIVRLTWEGMKPKQAKEQVLLMLENGQEADVVALLADMPVARRVKIAAEFKTPEEAKKLAKILQEMREGAPNAALIEGARTDLDQIESPQPSATQPQETQP
jgi:hypothetical protein